MPATTSTTPAGDGKLVMQAWISSPGEDKLTYEDRNHHLTEEEWATCERAPEEWKQKRGEIPPAYRADRPPEYPTRSGSGRLTPRPSSRDNAPLLNNPK